MNFSDDLQSRWWKLEEKLIGRFGKKPDVESVLFMVGIQELAEALAALLADGGHRALGGRQKPLLASQPD